MSSSASLERRREKRRSLQDRSLRHSISLSSSNDPEIEDLNILSAGFSIFMVSIERLISAFDIWDRRLILIILFPWSYLTLSQQKGRRFVYWLQDWGWFSSACGYISGYFRWQWRGLSSALNRRFKTKRKQSTESLFSLRSHFSSRSLSLDLLVAQLILALRGGN